ncbi:hypothetical protein EDC01DRAFT_654406 [Geopyxis carbonaria]|nr:hypothetical protein EDC01DRAFT_654406 [Geopyxis carbonaria]
MRFSLVSTLALLAAAATVATEVRYWPAAVHGLNHCYPESHRMCWKNSHIARKTHDRTNAATRTVTLTRKLRNGGHGYPKTKRRKVTKASGAVYVTATGDVTVSGTATLMGEEAAAVTVPPTTAMNTVI